ncbi:MAG: glycine--tRNA ligase, partial [Planctomycetota bacterium]
DPMVACKTEGCKKLFRADQLVPTCLIPTEYDVNLTADQAAKLMNADPSQAACRWIEEIGAYEKDREMKTRDAYIKRAIRAKKLTFERSTSWNFWFLSTDDGRRFAIWSARPGTDMVRSSDPCPICFGELAEPRAFNLMFETNTGALQDSSSKVYLRPETAQGIFVNFKNVMDSTRVKIPFGIAQIGKAFRNEINPRNFTFRSREFEQMEIEFFCHPNESMMWYEFWRDVRIKWYESLNIRSEKLRPRQQGKEELAHYSGACTDIEYLFPFSDEPQELEGVAHRGCYDLSQHGKHSRGDENAFAVIDDDTKEKFVPHVIEPSAGADRFTLATITEAYTVDETRASPEFMKFHPRLAPIKAAVFPLVAKDGLPEVGEPIYREIRKHYPCQYDAKQSIGKRYARMDEAGTPFCFTIDGQTKVDGTVTVRNRDDASQIRIDKTRCLEYLRDQLGL